MTIEQTAPILLALALLVTLAHTMGYAAVRLRQPRLIGEIAAGVLLGPFVIGRVFPRVPEWLFGSTGQPHFTRITLGFLSWLGLLLLMFLSGSEVRRVLSSENRRATAWILGVGTFVPFVAILLLSPALPLDRLTGTVQRSVPVLLVLAIAVAVTSIPVISRIFHDLQILHTRFASLVLSVAIVEDVALWAILAIATALASAQQDTSATAVAPIATHVAVTTVFMAGGLLVGPLALKRLHSSRWNIVVHASGCGYAMLVLFAYASVAALLDVNVVFAAFLAGFGLVGGFEGSERSRFAPALEAISQVSFGVFIPIYFALVGYQLDFGNGLSPALLVTFLVGSSLLRAFSVALASWSAGCGALDTLNLAVALNARGGPGIVLATVAYSEGIINGTFFTTLVITALVTSQSAGAWLGYVRRRGWPLLSEAAEPFESEQPAVQAVIT